MTDIVYQCDLIPDNYDPDSYRGIRQVDLWYEGSKVFLIDQTENDSDNVFTGEE